VPEPGIVRCDETEPAGEPVLRLSEGWICVILLRMPSTRIDWVAEHCHLLRSISAEFKDTLPFRGLTIGTGIHLEAKTVALLLTLRDGGARLVSTGNLSGGRLAEYWLNGDTLGLLRQLGAVA
jgi:hypothetical protein